MLLLKRSLRVIVPVVALVLGATVLVNFPVHAASCAHPTGIASIMYKLGVGGVKPCEVVAMPDGNGEGCAKLGHHCNDGSGKGRCTNVLDTTGTFSCQCVQY